MMMMMQRQPKIETDKIFTKYCCERSIVHFDQHRIVTIQFRREELCVYTHKPTNIQAFFYARLVMYKRVNRKYS